MKYADLHCDSITFCKDRDISLNEGVSAVNFSKLKNADCAVQTFAIFLQNGDTADFRRYFDFYAKSLAENSDKVFPVLNADDFSAALNGDKTGCILSVENLGFIGGKTDYIAALHAFGVRMASLVWNDENAFACPNGAPRGIEREARGLKDAGRAALAELDENGIIVDISHLSDGGAEEILTGRKIPAVASHSCAAAVCPVSRNLTDGLIKKIADCGGVIGVNFCYDFLGGGDAREKVYQNIAHIIKTGGEEVVAFGSDFDGTEPAPAIEDCTKVPALLEYLLRRGITPRALEKLAYKNFYRVFAEVCG